MKRKRKHKRIILLEPVKPTEEVLWQKWKTEIDDPLMQKLKLAELFVFTALIALTAYVGIFKPDGFNAVLSDGYFLSLLAAIILGLVWIAYHLVKQRKAKPR